MINILVRDADKNDYIFCRDLEKMMSELVKENRKITSQQILESFNKDFEKGGVKVVEHDGLSIGFFQLLTKGDFLYINEFHLCPDFRNKGVGSYLLELMEDEANKKHLPSIKLEVFLNNKAKSLYDRAGYKIISYTESNSVIMEKWLN